MLGVGRRTRTPGAAVGRARHGRGPHPADPRFQPSRDRGRRRMDRTTLKTVAVMVALGVVMVWTCALIWAQAR